MAGKVCSSCYPFVEQWMTTQPESLLAHAFMTFALLVPPTRLLPCFNCSCLILLPRCILHHLGHVLSSLSFSQDAFALQILRDAWYGEKGAGKSITQVSSSSTCVREAWGHKWWGGCFACQPCFLGVQIAWVCSSLPCASMCQCVVLLALYLAHLLLLQQLVRHSLARPWLHFSPCLM